MNFQQQSNLRILLQIFFIILLKQTCAQFTVPSPTCPGQEAVFRCTVVDNSGVSITAFRVNGDAAGQCMVSQSTVNPVTCGPDGEFTAALESISGNTYTLNLTVNATEGLNGTSVQCLNSGVDPAASPLLLIAKPMLPDEVRQDHNQDKEDSTTVIIWQPVIVDGDPGNIITYSITGELVVPSTTSTNTTVTLPALNTNYTFCVADDATNICGARSDAQKCATPPVIIEAEGPAITDIYSQLTCLVEPLAIRTLWKVDTSRNGNVLRPPVSSLTVICNGVSRSLTTTATEFTFTDAGCVSATAANITLTATNEVGSMVANTSVSSIYRTPVASGDTLQIKDGAVCFKLNPNCVESPSYQGFTAELQFTLDNDVIIIVFGSLVTCDNGVRGFKFNLAKLIELKLETFLLGTLTLASNGTIIQSINSLNIRQEESVNNVALLTDSRVALAAGVGGGVGGLVAVSALANLLLHAGLVLGWGYLCLLSWAGPCCRQENTKMRMHGGLAFCVLLFYLTPVATVLLTCYLCLLCCWKHSGDKEGKQVDVAMEANLCYGPVAGHQAPASKDRRPVAGEDTSQYETISH